MHDLFMHQSQASAYDLQIGSTWRKTYEGRNMLIMRSLFLFVREKEKKTELTVCSAPSSVAAVAMQAKLFSHGT